MSVQHIWNLFQLLGLLTCHKLANLSWNFITKTCKQLPGVDYVAKNWVLAMLLVMLVHFWSILLLKEQMMTSVRKTLKTLVWSAQNWSICSKICLENSHEIGHFFCEFVPKNPAKFDFFFHNLSEALIWGIN